MKKIYSLIATLFVATVASAQVMNVHLKDGSTVNYAADEVDYVDFTASDADAESWTLMSNNISFSEYYGNLPSFTCSLYKNADGTKYKFADFAKGVDLEFTIGADSVMSRSTYLGHYLYPEGGSVADGYENYWYFGDDTWNGSYPITWEGWDYYLDYACIYLNYSWSVFDPEGKWGYLCICATPYAVSDDSEGSQTWYYIEFYDASSDSETEEGGDSTEESGSDTDFTLTLADVAGSYTEATTGNWNGDCDYTVDVTIEIADEATNTVTVKGFSGASEDLTGVVDLDAKTITFAAKQPFATYYLFSAASGLEDAFVGKIASDGTISLKDWGAWYSYEGTYGNYAINMVSTLTKK
jgi:hypothetical protein